MPEEPTMSEHSVRLPLWSICLALTLGLGVVEGSLLGEHEVLAATVTGTQPAAGISAAQTAETKPALQTTFVPVVQKVMPSVVNIFSSRKIKADSRNLDPFLDDPLFRRFFGDQFGGQPPHSKRAAGAQSGLRRNCFIRWLHPHEQSRCRWRDGHQGFIER